MKNVTRIEGATVDVMKKGWGQVIFWKLQVKSFPLLLQQFEVGCTLLSKVFLANINKRITYYLMGIQYGIYLEDLTDWINSVQLERNQNNLDFNR